jgi:ferredoxin-NADP reductase
MSTDRQALRVAARHALTEAVALYRLESADGTALPNWMPGAHLEVELKSGAVRHYSLCGDFNDSESYEIAVQRNPGGRGGSVELYDTVSVGSTLSVSAPRNHFELHLEDEYLFIAGGIGITPILPMIQAAQEAGRPWKLVYLGRSYRTMAFADQLEQWGSRVSLWPKDERGAVDIAAILEAQHMPTGVYCCGSASLLRAVQDAAALRSTLQLHFELFEAAPPTDGPPDREFEVELTESGMVLSVLPGVSILNTLQGAGVDVPSSCGVGTCGTCETVVRSGVPDHRDAVLTPDEQRENQYMMICVSRSLSPRLVLER